MNEEERIEEIEEETVERKLVAPPRAILVYFNEKGQMELDIDGEVTVHQILLAGEHLHIVGEHTLKTQLTMAHQRMYQQQVQAAQEKAKSDALLRKVAQDIAAAG